MELSLLIWFELVRDVYHLTEQNWFQVLIYSMCGLMWINMVPTLKGKRKSEDQDKNNMMSIAEYISS